MARSRLALMLLRAPSCHTPSSFLFQTYCEVERARLTREMASMLEADGKLSEASEAMQDVAIETFTSMELREKAEFLLEQMRLTRDTADFIRMGILSNKMARKSLDDKGMEDLRIRCVAGRGGGSS